MSLDVYLEGNPEQYECPHCGQSATRNPELYSANITHNLTIMARAAGIYGACWRPDEHGLAKAAQLIPLLEAGVAKMKAEPKQFELLGAANGWGLYENFVPWVERYLQACREYPEANVRVSR